MALKEIHHKNPFALTQSFLRTIEFLELVSSITRFRALGSAYMKYHEAAQSTNLDIPRK